MKKVRWIMLGMTLLGAGMVWAQSPDRTPAQLPVQGVDVHNKTCPISGRVIGEMGPGVQVVYNGKIYHLCCGGCVAAFNREPEKFSKIAENSAG